MALEAARHELPIDNMRGAAWMIVGGVCFALTTAAIKFAAREVPAAEVAFFRCLFGLTVIAPFVLRQGWSVYRTTNPRLHVLRAVCAVAGLNLGFYAVTHLPLATAVSLGYTRPLFMIVLGALILRETVRWRRGLATVIGFLGVLVVLGPVDVTAIPPALAALGGAAATAIALAVVRQQAAVDGPVTILVWFATGTAIGTALPAALVWETPSGMTIWLVLAFIGIAATIGQYFIIRALTYGEATVMNPIDYAQIPMTAVLGYFFFGEVPPVGTWIGAAIIAASTMYILFRELRLQQDAKPPPPSP